MKLWTKTVMPLAVVFAAVGAGAAPIDDFRAALYDGRPAQAAQVAEAWVTSEPDSGAAGFALGTAQFLTAVENLGHGLYRYGLRSQYDLGEFGGLAGAPFLRLPVPQNPTPDPASYEALNGLLIRFSDDLAIAEATLSRVGREPFELSLDIGRVGLDLDRDGQSGPDESILGLFAATSGGMILPDEFMIDLDQSDAPWLQGYCNLLMAMANFPAAHDWSVAFDQTFHAIFPATQLSGTPLLEETRTLLAQLEKLRSDDDTPPRYPTKPKDMSWNEWTASPEYQRYQAYSRIKDALQYGSIADLVAFVHLFNWPVVDADRMASVRLHLLEMVRLSRENWRRIQAETDDHREWVPSPQQSGVLPRMRVTERTVEGWMMFLDEFEAVLNGDRLIPHWRFADRGINLKRMFEDPRPFDPVLIAQGGAVIPYLETGENITGDSVQQIFRLFEGGFFRYFVFFN